MNVLDSHENNVTLAMHKWFHCLYAKYYYLFCILFTGRNYHLKKVKKRLRYKLPGFYKK